MKASEIAARIQPVSDLRMKNMNILLYGPTGSGKTTECATAPAVIFIDTEDGALSAAQVDNGAERFGVETWEDLSYIMAYLESRDHGYKTVAFDTMSSLVDVALEYIKRELNGLTDPDEMLMTQLQDWGSVSALLKRLILQAKALPMHTVFTCHERLLNEDGRVSGIVPDLPPKVRNALQAACDFIGYCRVVEDEEDEPKFLTSFTPHPLLKTKDRLGLFPRPIENANLSKILRKIRKSGSTNAEATPKKKSATRKKKSSKKEA